MGATVGPVQAFCGCRTPRVAKCADQTAKHLLNVKIDLAVQDGTVELVSQSGPYHAPAADFDGKQVVAVFLSRGEVFQGFFQDAQTILFGTMQGTTANISTVEAFPPGEYEMALFVDVVPGDITKGPQRGDIAAFDNTTCDPTGVSVRFAVGCEDATVTLTNRHFIIF